MATKRKKTITKRRNTKTGSKSKKKTSKRRKTVTPNHKTPAHRSGSKASTSKFKVFNKAVPQVRVGVEVDTEGKWYGLVVDGKSGNYGYIALGDKKDRDELAGALVDAFKTFGDEYENELAELQGQLDVAERRIAKLKKGTKKRASQLKAA